MIEIPDHPDIRCIEATGYPRWMLELEDEEYEDEEDEDPDD